MLTPRVEVDSVEVGKAGSLMERFDALLFDLDGVVYVGPHAVPYAAESIDLARRSGIACVYVTNNAARTATSVAEHLTNIGVPAEADDVVTSPQAAASVLADYVPAGSKVLVIGGEGIASVLLDRGYVPVYSLDDDPAAVMQGYSPDLSWRDLAEATFAVRTGLPWIATNPDLTFPTARGVAPGNGSFVEIVGRTAGRSPDAVAGKPEPPLLLEAIRRSHSARPLMIGDRLDTDIEAGFRVDVPTLLVMTGVTTIEEILRAKPHERPDFIGPDLRTLREPYPAVTVVGGSARCREATSMVHDGVLRVDAGDDVWDAVRAVSTVAWAAADADEECGGLDAVAKQLASAGGT